MKRFVFTLNKLQSYKEQVLDLEKNKLAQLQREKARIEGKLETLHEAIAQTDRELKERQREGVTITEVRTYDFQIENMRFQIRQARIDLQTATERVEQQLQVVVTASQEVAGLDKLEEHQREEYRYEAARAEETVLAEYISTRLVRG